MAVDIRELRIGNHVFVNGVRAKIIDIHKDILNWNESPYRIFAEVISPETGKTIQVGCYAESDRLDPIPITEELLAELTEQGLGKIVDELKYNLLITQIDDIIGVAVWRKSDLKGNFHCQYLHELENFVYMTTKKELI